jgi:hypothetical protein
MLSALMGGKCRLKIDHIPNQKVTFFAYLFVTSYSESEKKNLSKMDQNA